MASKQRESGLASFAGVLARRWDVAAFAFFVTAAVAAGLAGFLPGLYRSRAVVVVEPPLLPGLLDEDQEARVHALTQENLSRAQLQALIERHDLRRTPNLETAAAALRKDITIETPQAPTEGQPATTAIIVSYIGRDAHKVAAVTDDLARFYVESERTRLKQRIETMGAQLDDLGKRLEAGEARVAQLLVTAVEDVLGQAAQPGASVRDRRRAPLGTLPEQLEAHVASIEDLHGQLEGIRESRAAAIERRRELERRSSAPRDPYEEEPAPRPRTLAERSEEARRLDGELERQGELLRELRGRFTDAHPDVVQAKRRVRQLERQAAEAARAPAPAASARAPVRSGPRPPRVDLGDQVRGVDAQLGVLSREERQLTERISSVKQSATDAPRRAQELASLLTRYEAPRAAYDALLRRYEELRMVHGDKGERVAFRVVENALPARAAEVPDRPRLLIVGIAIALLVAAAAVALAEQIDGSFHSVRDLNAYTRLPLLARIPRIATVVGARRQRQRAFRRGLLAAMVVTATVLGVGAIAHENDTVARMLVRRTP